MKVKLSILALALCGLFAFTSCDDDDNNYLPDQTVTKASMKNTRVSVE